MWLHPLINCIGHGGDGFLKFQDHEEISSVELADAFQQMWQKKRYACTCARLQEGEGRGTGNSPFPQLPPPPPVHMCVCVMSLL